MRVNSNKRLLSVAVLAAATALPVTPVFAQSGVLEEVVVTSRKRTENLQDVGFAVSALPRARLKVSLRATSQIWRTYRPTS